MSPIAKLLFDILARELVYFNGKMTLEYEPGSLERLRKSLEGL